MSPMRWEHYWREVRRIAEADPELRRLRERMDARLKSDGAGSAPYGRAERAWAARREVVEQAAKQEVSAAEVDDDRSDKAAYMRDYRASKRAAREAVDARRAPPAGQARN